MSEIVYATEEASYTDDQGKVVTLKAGEVVYTFEGPFCSAVILGFAKVGDTWWARVARPYAYASCVGTTGPTALLGAEVYGCNIRALKRHLGSPTIRIQRVIP